MTVGDGERGSGVLVACQKTAPWAASLVFLLTFFLFGCSIERHAISSPGTSQAIRVESGDRWFMDLEEDAAAGYKWYGKSNDSDVDVIVDHAPGKDGDGRVGAPGTAKVTIRVHRGYDGPSAVTFTYRRAGEKVPTKKFVISLFKRTGDVAAWE